MSDDSTSVTCEAHGDRQAAFVCQHLFSGSGLGFNWAEDSENPDAHCPDAWCDACNTAFEAAGEWTESAMALANIKLVCDRCYEQMRKRNWLQDSKEFSRLVRKAVSFLEKRQARLWKKFRIGEYERFDWDQETGQLVFSHGGKPRVIVDIVFVGSVSTRSNTWLWSWANDSYLENVKSRMREVRRYGAEHRLLKLAAAHWSATEHDGWEMTAVASLLLDAVGAYRSPSERGFSFMIMTRADWAH